MCVCDHNNSNSYNFSSIVRKLGMCTGRISGSTWLNCGANRAMFHVGKQQKPKILLLWNWLWKITLKLTLISPWKKHRLAFFPPGWTMLSLALGKTRRPASFFPRLHSEVLGYVQCTILNICISFFMELTNSVCVCVRKTTSHYGWLVTESHCREEQTGWQ